MRLTAFSILLIELLLLFSLFSKAAIKNIGIPVIQNYTKKEYAASTQNWGVLQDKRGFIYFANNDGLLEYDGSFWKLYQFSEPVLTRSLSINESGTLYVGMYNNFGAVNKNKSGKLIFTSFKNQLNDSIKEVGEIWRVHATSEGIFFQSFNLLMWFNPSGKIQKVIKSPGNFRFSFYAGKRLFIQELGKGLMEFIDDQLVLLPGLELFANIEIWSIVEGSNGKLIIGTSKDGVFTYTNSTLIPWKNRVNDFLKTNQIYSACKIDNNLIAFGTILDGLIVVSETGELFQHLNKSNGLQNNTILSLTTDNSGNLWLGLDNGIDFVEINSPFTNLYHPGGFGSGYSVAIHNGYLYLGTNNGLFATKWEEKLSENLPDFVLIPNTVGQIWHLGVYDGVLLCGHDNGTFQINKITAKKISDVKGVWKFLTMKDHPGFLIGGTYQGLTLFKKNKLHNSWDFEKKIQGFSESSRVMEQDDEGTIWMTHGFKGTYRIRLNANCDSVLKADFYDNHSGFATNNYINVFKIDGNAVFTSREGIYRFNYSRNFFERDTLFERNFDTREHVSYLKQDSDRNIWFVAGTKPGVLRYMEDGKYTRVIKSFEAVHNQMVAGFECIYPYSNNNVFFCLENGFAHYSPNTIVPGKDNFKTYIRKIEILHMDSTIYEGENLSGIKELKNEIPKFKYQRNGIRFLFSAPRFHGKRQFEFSFKLNDYNNNWSEWTPSKTCEYSNLPEGHYTFYVRARDPVGNISEQDIFSFRILPPWYRSNLAYFIYILIFLLSVWFIIWVIIKRIEISKRKERLKHLKEYRAKEQEYQREALMAEKVIINLKNEKLQNEMIHRDKELANQTFNLIQKNKFIVEIKEEIRKLGIQTREESIKNRMNFLIKRMDKDIDNEKQWELFKSAFDEVHEDFIKKVKDKFPGLSPKELQLCAYLRMDISTKELAALMNISMRGVEISRYRLRKKLDIDRETNLTKFLMDF